MEIKINQCPCLEGKPLWRVESSAGVKYCQTTKELGEYLAILVPFIEACERLG